MKVSSAERFSAGNASPAFGFRPLAESDLGFVATWLKTPHVARWWGDFDEALAEIRDHIASATVRPYLILMDGRPIGYIQDYDIHAEEDHPYRDQPVGAMGIDLSIGEPELIGKGIGPLAIDAFVRKLFAEGAPCVVIDPDPDNAQAIRAYEKAGFREFDRRTTIYGPAVMMARYAKDLT
jgi:aminoglycoside 6'-N-acetyltransferase